MSQRRITQIDIKDYRAFYGSHQIRLEKGENLLVFGENGSGKTSLYRAVLAFLQSTFAPQPVAEAVNIWQSTGTAPEIRLAFAEFDATGKKIAASEESFPASDTASPANDMAFPDYIKKANLSKGFFSYRELLKTHLIDSEEHTSFFELFLYVILTDFVYPGTGSLLQEEWAEINRLGSLYARSGNPADDPTTRFEEFNQQLQASLDLITVEMNEIIQYFKQGISIELTRTDAEFRMKTGIVKIPSIDIEVSLFDQSIPEHYNFLNEARLSALALSIYLAALKTNPTSSECKILFLDDTFIGLDMGNRLPLLSVLNDKFTDYQIFITTYDRAWFELAGTYLQGNWKAIEMYTKEERLVERMDGSRYPVGSVEELAGSWEIQFENALIIDPSLGYLSKAQLYFDKRDYPACANYQRKWCEQFLKGYLQENYRLEIGSDDSVQAITKLETLFNKLRSFYKDCGLVLPEMIEKDYPRHRDTVMNPFSHDDLNSPVYRQELERGFALIAAFETLLPLRKSVVAYCDDLIEYAEPSIGYSCRLKITSEPLMLIRHGHDLSVQGRGDVVDFTEDGITKPAPAAGMKDLTIDDFYDKIGHHLQNKYPGFLPNPDKFTALTIHPQKISLRDIFMG